MAGAVLRVDGVVTFIAGEERRRKTGRVRDINRRGATATSEPWSDNRG
jgi:hypothetical protein